MSKAFVWIFFSDKLKQWVCASGHKEKSHKKKKRKKIKIIRQEQELFVKGIHALLMSNENKGPEYRGGQRTPVK